MKTVLRFACWLPSLLLGVLLTGCGTAPGTNTGVGGDGGPWPQGPNRNTNQTGTTDPERAPLVPVIVTLRAKAPAEQELRLDIAQIDIRYGDRNWLPVARREEIVKQEALPLRIGPKGNTVLLIMTKIPRRKYSYLRVTLVENKCLLVKDDVSTVLAVSNDAPLALGEWTPDEKLPNVLALTLDSGKIALAPTPAIAAEALSVKAGVPTGAINGKLAPALPTARVEAYWGTSKVSFGAAAPSAQDGSFTLPNLPAGSYRLEITATGHHLAAPLKELTTVEDKPVTLKLLELEKDEKTPEKAPDKVPEVKGT